MSCEASMMPPNSSENYWKATKMNDRRFDDDSDFSGMTKLQVHRMIGKILNASTNEQKFNLKKKHAIAEFCENMATDETNSPEIRLQAVDRVLKMETMNMEYDKIRLQVEMAVMKSESTQNDGVGEPQVILVLPQNGSEIT